VCDGWLKRRWNCSLCEWGRWVLCRRKENGPEHDVGPLHRDSLLNLLHAA